MTEDKKKKLIEETKKFWEEYFKNANTNPMEQCLVDARRILHIKDDEKIYSYFWKRKVKGFFKKSVQVVLTDKSLYAYRDNGKGPLSWDLIDICKYVVISVDKACIIIGKNGRRYELYIPNSLLKDFDTIAEELPQLIRKLQRDFYKATEQGKLDRKELLDYVINETDSQLISKGTLDSETKLVLKELLKEEDFRYQVSRVLVKECILDINVEDIIKLIKQVYDKSDNEQQEFIEFVKTEIEKRYDEVTDFSKDFNKNGKDYYFRVEESEKNSGKINRLIDLCNNRFPIIVFYYRLRNCQFKKIEEVIESYNYRKMPMGKNIEEVLLEWNKHNIVYMKECWDKLMQGEEIKYYSYSFGSSDGYGLSELHYGMILDDTNSYQYLLREKIYPINPYKNCNTILSNIFEYSFLAAYKGRWEVVDYLYELSDEYLAVLKSKKAAEKTLKELIVGQKATELITSALETVVCMKHEASDSYHEKLDEAEKDLINGRNINYAKVQSAQSQLEEFDKKLESCDNGINNFANLQMTFEEKICEVQDLISEIEEELLNLKEQNRECYLDYISAAKKSNDPFIKIILGFYSNSKKRGDYFRNEDNIIISVEGKYFCVNKDLYDEVRLEGFKEDSSKCESESNDTEKFEFKRPYGEHWFSDAAYMNIKIMKKEYRQLAKKYHPDNCKGYAKVFVEIQAERVEILKRQK